MIANDLSKDVLVLLKTLIKNKNELATLLGQVLNVVVLDCRFYLTDHSKGQIRNTLKGIFLALFFVDVQSRSLPGSRK